MAYKSDVTVIYRRFVMLCAMFLDKTFLNVCDSIIFAYNTAYRGLLQIKMYFVMDFDICFEFKFVCH